MHRTVAYTACKMEAFDTISPEIKQQVCSLWLARPEKRNAIDDRMADELMRCFHLLERDDAIQVVVLRGRGKLFSAGADLHWMKNPTAAGPGRAPAVLFPALLQTLYRFSKPLIVLVHGHAAGGALGLLSCADFVLAEQGAGFAFSEVRLGLVPAMIAPYVIRRTGLSRARQMMLEGEVIPAAAACQAGLVDQVADAASLEEALARLCERLLRNAPGAMAACKQLLLNVADMPMDERTHAYTAGVLEAIQKSDEAREGIQAFLENRPPRWRKV